jgi:hypothetical protein
VVSSVLVGGGGEDPGRGDDDLGVGLEGGSVSAADAEATALR